MEILQPCAMMMLVSQHMSLTGIQRRKRGNALVRFMSYISLLLTYLRKDINTVKNNTKYHDKRICINTITDEY
jgi:hypothetical protein